MGYSSLDSIKVSKTVSDDIKLPDQKVNKKQDVVGFNKKRALTPAGNLQ